MSDSANERFWWIWLPEAIGYFLLGAVTLILGAFAVVRWSADHWAAGAHASVIAVVLAALAALCVFAVATRGKRRALAAAAVVVWFGVVAFVLAGHGFSIPSHWWP
jgi:hypothetical protein